MTNDYRFDKRSPSEFKKAIKDAHRIERQLMTVYVEWLNFNRPSGPEYTFQDHGVDNSGKFIKELKNVNCNADFLLCRHGKRDKKIEIKFCRRDLKSSHLKINQLKRYLRDDVCIINFMGIDTPDRRFSILTPKIIDDLLEKLPVKRMWSKDCIEVLNSTMEWHYV